MWAIQRFRVCWPIMFDEPEGEAGESPSERARDPATAAREKADEFRMHAELAAVFEGVRKFDAHLVPGLDPEVARQVQRSMGRLEKAKSPEHPVLMDPAAIAEASAVLRLPTTDDGGDDQHPLSPNDYHIHRRPGEVMIVRWLAGDEVDAYYERLQAHFDAAMAGYRDEERSAREWKGDPQTLAYLKALDAIELRMAERYLREPIRQHHLYVLSTQSADEMNIAYLCDHIMNVPAAEVVGARSAPPEDAPTERDLAWFFKLFSLRGVGDDVVERMCFFTYLQKADDEF
jgi:hypothetical protein